MKHIYAVLQPLPALFLLASSLLLPAANLAAQNVKRPLPPDLVVKLRLRYSLSGEICASLREKGEASRFQDSTFSSLILPDPQLAMSLLADMKKLSAVLLVEALFVIPVEEGITSQEKFRLNIYNVLHKINTMKGLQYYSATNNKMQTMFNDSYVIANPDSRTPLPNPIAQSIPARDTIYVYQDDTRFGENTYEASYRYTGSFHLSMKNLTTMYYGIVPIVGAQKMRMDIIILPADDHLLFYSCIGADALTFFGLEKRALPSFSNRIYALFSWFMQNLF
ncbi:MAG: hypothetical protein LBC67_04730 [Spirochaetales bacterium]|jgi:hypothetical protein|nr:hypothetical protein [Spirochaetales bacterium]